MGDRIIAMGSGGGTSYVALTSSWRGNLRWARNRVSTGGETQLTQTVIGRTINGATGMAQTNSIDDGALRRTVRYAEALLRIQDENPERYPDVPPVTHPHVHPTLWFDATYAVDARARGEVAEAQIRSAEAAGVLAAGYVETAAIGASVRNTDGVFRYYPYTSAQYSVTVRDPKHGGSGWAGVDWNDWRRIDIAALTATALDKCLRSRNPVAIEPGRHTTILEPQAVCDLFAPVIERALDREDAERGSGPFAAGGGNSKIGERVLDTRITVSTDPMDSDCGFIPFDWNGEPMQAVNWIEHGVLKELAYDRSYGLRQLTKDFALPNSRAFRISGGTVTIDEMIATTERGVLVTRFNNVAIIDRRSMLCTGNTRDGFWLIERGKISKSIKNFRFTDSPLFAFNNIEQLGRPQRVFRPLVPAVCPPLKVRDFNFNALMDAV